MAKNLQCFLHSKEAGRYLLDDRCYSSVTKDLLLKHNLMLIEKYSCLEVSRRKLVVLKKPIKEIYIKGRILCFLDRTTSERFLAFLASTKSPMQKRRANMEFSISAQQIRNVEDTNPAILQKDNVFQIVYQEGNTYGGIQVGIEYLCAISRYMKIECIKKIRSFCIESVDMALPDKYHAGVWRAEAVIPYYDCCNKPNKLIPGCTNSKNYDEAEDEESEELKPYMIYKENDSNKACLYDSGYVALTDSSQRHIAADTVEVPKDSGSSAFYSRIEEEDVCSSSEEEEYEYEYDDIGPFRPPPPPLRPPEIPPRVSILAQEFNKMQEERRGNSPTKAAATKAASGVYENTTEERKVDCKGETNSEQRSRPNCKTTESVLTEQHASSEIKAHSPAINTSDGLSLLSLNLSEDPDSDNKKRQEQQRCNSSSKNAMTTSKLPSNREPNTRDNGVQTSLSLAASNDQNISNTDGCNCPRTDPGCYCRVPANVTGINHGSNCAANNNCTHFPFNHPYGRNDMLYGPTIEYHPHEVVYGQMPDGLYHPQPYFRPASVYYSPPGPQNLQQRQHSVYRQQPGPHNLQKRLQSVYCKPSDAPDPEQRAQSCRHCSTKSPCQPTASRR